MRKMVCIRDCHGFRGGTWRKGETVDFADGEPNPVSKVYGTPHFVPSEQYSEYLENENRPKPRMDTMKPVPTISPIPIHLQGRGGISTVKPADFVPAPASNAGTEL